MARGFALLILASGLFGLPAQILEQTAPLQAAEDAPIAGSPNIGSPITELPFTIFRPGRYRLSSDLTYDSLSGAAVVVAADDVVIDLAGHRLSGSNDPSTAAVGILASNRQRVTIRNGTISGFYFGIDIRRSTETPRHSTGHKIAQVVASSNYYFGMRVEATSSTIDGCQILETGGTTRPGHTIPIGVRMVGENNVLKRCCIRGLDLKYHPDGRGEIVGVHFDDAPGCLMEENRLIDLTTDADRPAGDNKERRFGLWINGGKNKTTYLRVVRNRIFGFTVPVVFSPGADGEAVDNQFQTTAVEPVRGKPTGKVTGNSTQSPARPIDCP